MMDRKAFLGALGLGAVGAALPVVAKGAEAVAGGRAPSWWMDGDWTVVYTPIILGNDDAFEPHLLVPGCPRHMLVCTGVIVVDADGVRRDLTVSAHTATDTLGVIVGATDGEDVVDAVRGPFWLLWPDRWVALASTGAVGLRLPQQWESQDGKRGATVPHLRSHGVTSWGRLDVPHRKVILS